MILAYWRQLPHILLAGVGNQGTGNQGSCQGVVEMPENTAVAGVEPSTAVLKATLAKYYKTPVENYIPTLKYGFRAGVLL